MMFTNINVLNPSLSTLQYLIQDHNECSMEPGVCQPKTPSSPSATLRPNFGTLYSHPAPLFDPSYSNPKSGSSSHCSSQGSSPSLLQPSGHSTEPVLPTDDHKKEEAQSSSNKSQGCQIEMSSCKKNLNCQQRTEDSSCENKRTTTDPAAASLIQPLPQDTSFLPRFRKSLEVIPGSVLEISLPQDMDVEKMLSVPDNYMKVCTDSNYKAAEVV